VTTLISGLLWVLPKSNSTLVEMAPPVNRNQRKTNRTPRKSQTPETKLRDRRKQTKKAHKRLNLESIAKSLEPLNPEREEFSLVAEIVSEYKKPLGDWWVKVFFKDSPRSVFPKDLHREAQPRLVKHLDILNSDDYATCLLRAIGRDWAIFAGENTPVPIKLLHKITQVASNQISHAEFSKWLVSVAGVVSTKNTIMPAIDNLIGHELQVTILQKGHRDNLWDVTCPELPESWEAELLSRDKQSYQPQEEVPVWVYDVKRKRRTVKVSDDLFGRLPSNDRARERYLQALAKVREAIVRGNVDIDDSILASAFSEVKGMFNRTVKKDQGDWFLVWCALQKPPDNSSRETVQYLGDIAKGLRRARRSLAPLVNDLLGQLKKVGVSDRLGDAITFLESDNDLIIARGQHTANLSLLLQRELDRLIEDGDANRLLKTLDKLGLDKEEFLGPETAKEATISADMLIQSELDSLFAARDLTRVLKAAKRYQLSHSSLQPKLAELVQDMVANKRVGEVLSAAYSHQLKLDAPVSELLLLQYEDENYSGFLKQADRFKHIDGIEGQLIDAIIALEERGQMPQAEAYKRKFGELGLKFVSEVQDEEPEQMEASDCHESQLVARFVKALQHWHPTVNTKHASIFHAVLASNPIFLAPRVTWLRAYKEAIGSSCVLRALPVSPTWLSFYDAWEVLREPWEEAVDEPERLILICLDSADHSIDRYWLGTLRQLANDEIGQLPDGNIWPKNLRLALTTTRDSETSLASESLLHGLPAGAAYCDEVPDHSGPLDLSSEEFDSVSWLESFAPACLLGGQTLRRSNLTARTSALFPTRAGLAERAVECATEEWPQGYGLEPAGQS
jgi:hypothetical protein